MHSCEVEGPRGPELAVGAADEVRDRILEAAKSTGAGKVLVHLNRGAMPHDMFVEQIRISNARYWP